MSYPTTIELDQVSKCYANAVLAVDHVSLDLPRGKILALLGPSGCGKSTTLRLIAGLEQLDSGAIYLEGICVASERVCLPPEARRVGMVFQDYALFPHLTVAKNIAFPLNSLPGRARQQRVADLLSMVGLETLEERYPHQLSGGQQQRVALARALATDPSVVLLDEPFSNLDATLRQAMRVEIGAILKAAHATTIFVTHDREEAFCMADLVAVMFDGAIVQIGSPREIYTYPVNRAVATFGGEANFVAGHASGDYVECVLGQLRLVHPAHGPVDLLIRPEVLRLIPDEAGMALVERITFSGCDQSVELRLHNGTTLQARVRSTVDLSMGTRVRVAVETALVAY